jgi:hypothetical protein
MFTYFARPRGFLTEPLGTKLEFPCAVEAVFTFEPGSPFGPEGPIGQTFLKGTNLTFEPDLSRGILRVISGARLPSVKVDLRGTNRNVAFEGASMKISFNAASWPALKSILETYYCGIPALFSIDLTDVPVVSEVRGTAGKVPFLGTYLGETAPVWVTVATKEMQEGRIVTAFERLKLLDEKSQGPRNRRLLAATLYFYRACRLNRAQSNLGEFLAESLLNNAKILEVLFPGPPEKTIECARAGLKSLGFSEEEIEALYIPTLSLRSAIDVAHPMLAVFSEHEAASVHRYADAAEGAFRRLLERVYQRVADGSFVLEAVKTIAPSTEARKIIKRMAENLARYKEVHGSQRG